MHEHWHDKIRRVHFLDCVASRASGFRRGHLRIKEPTDNGPRDEVYEKCQYSPDQRCRRRYVECIANCAVRDDGKRKFNDGKLCKR